MQSYRCVFSYASGKTTIAVSANDGAEAIDAAASAIGAGDYDRVEVWDGETLLLTRTTPRAWNALAEAAAQERPVGPEQFPTAPMPPGLPRRWPTLFAGGLLRSPRASGVRTRWSGATRKINT